MNKQDVYKQLSERMVLYVDLVKIPLKENGEKLVKIINTKNLKTREINPQTRKIIEKDIFVRESVATKLEEASVLLASRSEDYVLEVIYGHRSMAIQRDLFELYKNKYSKKYSGIALLEATHRSIAVPEVAGHPTGGAVDIRILRKEKPINMGTTIWEFVPDSFTFSPFISKQAWDNRGLLREIMQHVGFAPYDGEWWHFSYGDKEWARYYRVSAALYDQLELKSSD